MGTSEANSGDAARSWAVESSLKQPVFNLAVKGKPMVLKHCDMGVKNIFLTKHYDIREAEKVLIKMIRVLWILTLLKITLIYICMCIYCYAWIYAIYNVWPFNYSSICCTYVIVLIWLPTVTFDCHIIWIFFLFIINCYPICDSIPLLCVSYNVHCCIVLYLPTVIICHIWLDLFLKPF